MSKNLKRKLAFFRACLDAENRAKTIWNFPTRKSELVRKVSLISSTVDLPGSYLAEIGKVLEFYSREKCLQLSSIFIIGKHWVPSFGGTSKFKAIKCPIFLFQGDLINDKVIVDIEQGGVNPAAVQILSFFDIDHEQALNLALGHLAKNDLSSQDFKGGNNLDSSEGLKDISILKQTKVLAALSLEEVIELLGYALELASNQELKIEYSSKLSIESKSQNARGSLYELELMQKQRGYSRPLELILGERTVAQNNDSSSALFRRFFAWVNLLKKPIPLPVTLSSEQAKAVKAANDFPLSVISGPPGTGKSFTIACLALREFSQGNSVLIVSQNQHAADVVRRKLIDDMGVDVGLTALVSERRVSSDAKQQIKKMLASNYDVTKNSLKNARKDLDDLIQKISELETNYLKDINALQGGSGARSNRSQWRDFWRFGSHHTNQTRPIYQQFLDIEELEQQVKAYVTRLVRLKYQTVANQLSTDDKARRSLNAFADSLTARNEHYQKNYYSNVNFEHVVKAIPLWFAAVGNLQRALPLHPELFDLIVIDEATQCNLSICLPALQRAKRAVIVGDNKQLKHMSFLSVEQQIQLANQYQVSADSISSDFRTNSVLDYAEAACQRPQQKTLLDEHFRSHPQIIEFSNREFYQNSLKVMTERPTNRQKAVELVEVNGKRLSKGLNKIEAETVIKRLRRTISEQRRLPESEVHTVGILAFFSTQARHLEKMVFDKIELNDLRRHNVRVGTPFSFQGEERDHMLISCSVDAQTPGASYTYLNRDDVFNVAITRARHYQTIFLSCDVESIRRGSKLSDYVKYLLNYQIQTDTRSHSSYDAFQSEIVDWLNKRGVDTYKNYLVAGASVDIMAVYQGHSVAIDLVGFDGPLKGALSLNQLKLLNRAGLESFLLAYSEWREQPETLLHALMLRLGVAHQQAVEVKQLDKFSDNHVDLLASISGGVSINHLHTRFLNTGEVAANQQLKGLVARYFRFIELLNKNFIVGELTYKRYHNAVNDLCAMCLENLQKASVAAELANSMLAQQKELYGSARAYNQFDNEFDDVTAARLSMIDQQRDVLKSCMLENEKAILQIDKAMIKLVELDESDSLVDPIEALKELTERLEMYRGLTR